MLFKGGGRIFSLVKINFILCSRNDDYCGSPLHRLRMSLQHNLSILDKYSDWKITIVDWGSDDRICGQVGISDPRIEFKYVAKSITQSFKTSFSEVHCLNYAARISQSEFIGRLDQDTMIGERFLSWFFQKNLCDRKYFYFCKRTDLKPGVFHFLGDSTPNAPLEFEPWICAVGIFLVPTYFFCMNPRATTRQTFTLIIWNMNSFFA